MMLILIWGCFLYHFIRPANSRDLAYVLHLQSIFAKQLGFLPRSAFVRVLDYRTTARILIAEVNSFPVAYLLYRPLSLVPSTVSIVQAAVEFDLQRSHHGFALLDRVSSEAYFCGFAQLQCWCASHLLANYFWSALDFVAIGYRDPRSIRAHRLICWRRLLDVSRPQYFNLPPPVAGWRGRRVDNFESLPALDFQELQTFVPRSFFLPNRN